MHISLSENDFHPLIHIHSKWMSYEDKVKHGIPSTIDEWIAYGKTRTNAPTANPHKRGPFGEYPLWQDDVECILRVIRKEVSVLPNLAGDS